MEVFRESMSRRMVEKLCKASETKKERVIGFLVYTFGVVGLGQGQ